MTDAELVRRILDGDRRLREQFVRRWSPRMLAVCRARLGRDHAAEDLTQETLLRGLNQLGKLEDPQKLGAWLRGIAVNLCHDWLRARQRDRASLSVLTGNGDGRWTCHAERPGNADVSMELQERHLHLQQEIDALPEELREPLLLFYYDDVTYDQIADLLGVSKATVNSRLAKARRHLARRLAHLVR